jgi:CheY-like chemotaxis protein
MRILILDPTRHWSSVQAFLDANYVINDAGAYPPVEEPIDLAIVGDERPWVNRRAIRHVQARGIPVLFFPDGILEWRNQFSNPLLVDPREAVPTVFMPVLSDKVACIGRSQARVLDSWGNWGKCEIVGAPRLDYCIGLRRKLSVKRPSRGGESVLLVQTARTPAFNEEQEKKLVQALSDVNQLVSLRNQNRSHRIRVVWRLSAGLREKLPRLTGEVISLAGVALAELLATVDAVISTPSTAMLEAMACGIPTALLDYNNAPQYVQAAWSVTCPEHLPSMLEEILEPPAPRLLCQEYFAQDSLELRNPASVQAARLISEMITIKRKALRGAPRRRVDFPPRILYEADSSQYGRSDIPLQSLYPGHSVFLTDTAQLQVEVAELRMGVRDLYRWIKLENEARRVLRVLRTCRRHFGAVRKINSLWARLLEIRPAGVLATVMRVVRASLRDWTNRRHTQVLVVDDDPFGRQWLVDSLTSEGHEVDAAADGRTAVAQLRHRSYDLIITDLRMPQMDGVAFYRWVEGSRPHMARRVVFLSGNTEEAEYRGFVAEKRDRTVAKPVRASELNRLVESILAN